MAELDPTERYQLRKLQMDVDKKIWRCRKLNKIWTVCLGTGA